MNIIKCPTNNPKCRYRVECDNRRKKYQEISPFCPGEETDFENTYNILKCNNNNLSRACPVLLCNYAKQAQQNIDIYQRNVPDCKVAVSKSFRGGYNVCRKHIDLDEDDEDTKVKLSNIIVDFENLSAPFVPGKGKGSDFLKRIDVDSELKLLNYNNTLCPSRKRNVANCIGDYNKCLELKSQKDCSGQRILSDPLCENTKECIFNNSTNVKYL